MNILTPANSAGCPGEEQPLPGASEAGQLLALHQAGHLPHLPSPLLSPGCLSLAPHVVRQVPGVGSVGPDQLSLSHPRQGGVTHVTARTCTLQIVTSHYKLIWLLISSGLELAKCLLKFGSSPACLKQV